MNVKRFSCYIFGIEGPLIRKKDGLLTEGVEKCLRRLRESGACLTVFTVLTHAEAVRALDKNGILSYFDGVFGCDDISYSKKEYQAYSELLKRIGASAEETAMIDADAEVIRAAKAEGLYGVGFGRGLSGMAVAAVCDTLLKSYSDLDYLGREIPLHRVSSGLGGGSLLQVSNRSHTQMMSYVIDTPDGNCVVIDGGNHRPEDARHLEKLIRERGGRVHLWILTHGHSDHIGALLWLMEQEHMDIQIDELYFTFPPTEWFKQVENGYYYVYVRKLLSALSAHGIESKRLERGQILECGGMSFSVLGGCSGYANYHTINDTTVVIKAHFPKRDVLFLGDLAPEGGKDLVEECGAEALRCDIVQMAHHGQNGVEKDFYEMVRPKICLYTAPDWLWNNDNGGGVGSGEWKTLETRRWMEELGAEASYPCADGDYSFQ